VKLAVKPTHLKEFAAQVQLIASMREEERNLFKATSQVCPMSVPWGVESEEWFQCP